jgi:hypothetical protein
MSRKQADYIASTSNEFFPRKCGTLEERFWSKISPEPNTGCWIWCGDSNGNYGSFGVYDVKTNTHRNEYAHRFSYRLHKGEIPLGFQIDHCCRMKLCVNPDHLELVTPRENTLRGGWNKGQFQIKTHCKRGHPLSGNNLGIDCRGYAKCRICVNTYTANKRPYVPRAVRIAVLLRQCDDRGIAAPKRYQSTDGEYIKEMQMLIFGNEVVHLDHNPSLVNRDFDEDTGLYSPDANDPKFLIYMSKEDHRIKTYVHGHHGAHSDLGLRRKNKQIAKNRDPHRRKSKIAQPKNFKWPSRPFRTNRPGGTGITKRSPN